MKYQVKKIKEYTHPSSGSRFCRVGIYDSETGDLLRFEDFLLKTKKDCCYRTNYFKIKEKIVKSLNQKEVDNV